MTQCYITTPDKEQDAYLTLAVGETVQSRQDNFCRATGRKIALARALAVLTNDRELRKSFWDAYFWSQMNSGAQAMFTAAQQVFDSLERQVKAQNERQTKST